jgi:hypothetical protein
VNGNEQEIDFMAHHRSNLNLGSTKTDRLDFYRQLLNQGIDDNVRKELTDATNGNFVLGDIDFKPTLNRSFDAEYRLVAQGGLSEPTNCSLPPIA